MYALGGNKVVYECLDKVRVLFIYFQLLGFFVRYVLGYKINLV